jgi:hypothetical protein
MRTPTIKQACLAAAQIITITVCLITQSHGQTSNPTPPPPQTGTSETAGDTGPDGPPYPPREYNDGALYFGEGDQRASFSEAIEGLTDRASALLPIIRDEIEGKLLPWLEGLSVTVALIVMIFAFAKLWRENAGAGVDLFWWFARVGIILSLLGSGPKIINGMFEEGKKIADGEGGQGALLQFYLKQQRAFDDSYTKFTENMFTIGNTPVKSSPGGLVGVLFSNESSIPDPKRLLEGISKDMTLLYDGLNFSRGVISFGDLFLTVLGSFLLIVMRLAAPIMIALAVDRSLAQRTTYPFVWGVVVLTLIWPIVTHIIKSIAYMGGNIAMALGDNKVFHSFDDNAMRVIQHGDPFYTALFAAVIMLISGLCLWAAPYIAYQLSAGRVYEGVSQAISSWVGQLMGVGISYYSTAMAAGLQKEAELLQANAQLAATEAQSKAVEEAGKRYAAAGRILGTTQANASATYQNEMARLGANYQVATADAQFALMTGIFRTDDPRQAGKFGFGPSSDAMKVWGALSDYKVDWAFPARQGMTGLDSFVKTYELLTSYTQDSSNIYANKEAAFINGFSGLVGAAAAVKGGPAASGAVSSIGNLIATEMQTGRQQTALNDATLSRLQVYGGNVPFKDPNAPPQIKPQQDMVYFANNNMQRNAAIDYERGSIKASNASAREIIGGYNKVERLTLEGNRIIRDGSIQAGEIVRDASVGAAGLRYKAALVSELGRSAAKDIEQALTLRY